MVRKAKAKSPKVVKPKAEKPKVEKPKKVKVKVEVEKPKKVKVRKPSAVIPPSKPAGPYITTKEFPTFDGKKIIRVLPNKAPKGFVLCEAMDGNTKVEIHVPKELVI